MYLIINRVHFGSVFFRSMFIVLEGLTLVLVVNVARSKQRKSGVEWIYHMLQIGLRTIRRMPAVTAQ